MTTSDPSASLRRDPGGHSASSQPIGNTEGTVGPRLIENARLLKKLRQLEAQSQELVKLNQHSNSGSQSR